MTVVKMTSAWHTGRRRRRTRRKLWNNVDPMLHTKWKEVINEFVMKNTPILFIPQMHFPNGVCVWTSDNGVVSSNRMQQTVEYIHKSNNTTRKKVIITAA